MVEGALTAPKTVISAVFYCFFMMTLAAQPHQAGRVFETPSLKQGRDSAIASEQVSISSTFYAKLLQA